MPNTREKLIELIRDGDRRTFVAAGMSFEEKKECCYRQLADHLIANGVTFAEDNNVPSKWISVEDEQKPKDRRNYFIAYVFGDSDMHFFGEAKYHAHEGNDLVNRPHFSNEGVNEMRVTHWMEIPKLPLPQPPKGD